MTVEEFVKHWRGKQDIDGTPAVGIDINWEKIPKDATVLQYNGHEAWMKIGDFYHPIWGGFNRTTLREWLNPNCPDYAKFIESERQKIEFYRQNGLTYFEFCAFSDMSGSTGILGDGSHRYIDCNYLIINGANLKEDIKKCKLDILCLFNLGEVIPEVDMPPEFLQA